MRPRHSLRDIYDVIRVYRPYDHWDALWVALNVWCDLNAAGLAR